MAFKGREGALRGCSFEPLWVGLGSSAAAGVLRAKFLHRNSGGRAHRRGDLWQAAAVLQGCLRAVTAGNTKPRLAPAVAPSHRYTRRRMKSPKRKKKSPRSPATPRTQASSSARRLLVTLFTTCVDGLQATSCGLSPSAIGPAPTQSTAPSVETGTANSAASFKECPQHFAGGRPLITPAAPKLRALCFDAFAVLHSGNTKTPVYLAERA